MSENGGTPIRVLAVDDAKSSIAIVGSLLRSQGCVLVAAKSGEEALRIAAGDRPDIILLDVKMLNGYETVRGTQNRLTGSPPMYAAAENPLKEPDDVNQHPFSPVFHSTSAEGSGQFRCGTRTIVIG